MVEVTVVVVVVVMVVVVVVVVVQDLVVVMVVVLVVVVVVVVMVGDCVAREWLWGVLEVRVMGVQEKRELRRAAAAVSE